VGKGTKNEKEEGKKKQEITEVEEDNEIDVKMLTTGLVNFGDIPAENTDL
jgi:hypothetical protein